MKVISVRRIRRIMRETVRAIRREWDALGSLPPVIELCEGCKIRIERCQCANQTRMAMRDVESRPMKLEGTV